MWFKIQGQQVHLRILVKPHAKKTAILGVREHRLQIAIHAKPHEGEANKALMVYLATLLKLPKSKIVLQQGESARYKQISLPLTENVKAWIEAWHHFQI